MLVKGLAAIHEGLKDSVEDKERDLSVGSVGRVSSLEEEGKECGPGAGGELALGNLGDDTSDGVSDGSDLLIGDDLEQLGLNSVPNVYGLLGPHLASALCKTFSELNRGELTDSQVGRGSQDLEESGDALWVLVVVVLELLGGGLDSVGVGNIALLQELVKPLNKGGLRSGSGRRVGERFGSAMSSRETRCSAKGLGTKTKQLRLQAMYRELTSMVTKKGSGEPWREESLEEMPSDQDGDCNDCGKVGKMIRRDVQCTCGMQIRKVRL